MKDKNDGENTESFLVCFSDDVRAKHKARFITECSWKEKSLECIKNCTPFVMEYPREVETDETTRRSLEALMHL